MEFEKSIIDKYNMRQHINTKLDYYSSEIDKFPKNSLGMTIDKARELKEFKIADSHCKKWFSRLQEFNKGLSKKEKILLVKYKKSIKKPQ